MYKNWAVVKFSFSQTQVFVLKITYYKHYDVTCTAIEQISMLLKYVETSVNGAVYNYLLMCIVHL